MIQITLKDRDIRNLENVLICLTREKLVVSPSIMEEIKYQTVKNGSFLKFKQYCLTAISRAILTKDLIECIKDNNRSTSLQYYTIPIVDMNWEYAEEVKGYFDQVKMVS
ncbi:MAG: hypothetical protein H6599_11425 [Flavobacteriales bacterium]|nr:hypothetical protein [Flavobacteriales bacterium]